MTHGLGYRPDEHDERDAKFALGTLSLPDPPSSASLVPLVLDVLNQNPLPSCVSNAYAQAWRMVEERDKQPNDPISKLTSRLAHHYNSRSQHGDEKDPESGTYIRLCIKQANKLGRAPESAWPYDVSKVCDRPPLNVYRLAYDHVEAKYHRIAAYEAARVDEVKRAIASGKPVVFGTSVTESFLSHNGDGVVGVPTLDESIAGGHAMVIVGYDERGAEIVNSWGSGWGSGGFAFLSWEYIQWPMTRDLWALDR